MTITPDAARFMILSMACFLAVGASLLLIGVTMVSGRISREEEVHDGR